MPTIKKVLIANRGEIACRIARTCQALGIRTVAVYSEPDRLALHTLLCGEAVPIGPAASNESYLVAEKILDAARSTGADAIHPGYGFLSENAGFARAVAEAGLTWIGPPPEAIEAMGLKTEARTRMIAAGVPVVPGTETAVPDAAAAVQAAKDVGFPLLIKASAGGGGKGMRIVEDPKDLESAFERASSEALAVTGDGTCYLERYFPRAHHIEVQILSGPDGIAQAVGERECSVQRRHQKVVEECPSPFLDNDVRAALYSAATQAADACGYIGAGTVEFLVDPEKNFYFLEMNTRLQVEHPVTEMVYGIDLVEAQIRVAEGQPAPVVGPPRGWAIQCRVYAEDPKENFRPSPGHLHVLKEPHCPSLRVDSGVYQGAEVSMFYDPMISKVVAWGADREAAIRRMIRGLEEYVVEGVATTLPFCLATMRHPVFASGDYTTSFVGGDLDPTTLSPEGDAAQRDLAAIAAALIRRRNDRARARDRAPGEAHPGAVTAAATGMDPAMLSPGDTPYALAGRLDRLRKGRF